MFFKKISTEMLNEWIDSLLQSHNVIGVQAKNDKFVFAPLYNVEDLRLDYDVTILPPKSVLQPNNELLLKFNMNVGYQSVFQDESYTLLGIHPYDMVAIMQMDDIFSEGDADVHYLTRRKNATIIVVDVQNVSKDVFAGYMGTAYIEDGYDILLTNIGDEYLVDTKTEKGDILLSSLEKAPDAGEKWFELRKLVWHNNEQKLRKHELKASWNRWPELLEESYDHIIWEEKARLCFSCGSCNLVCPTCYCFDILDQINWDLRNGSRVRLWDGCMLADFATVSGNLNFRKEPAMRYRHRYYRKGLYVPRKIGGHMACVGCGRCISACVASIANPVEVFNRLAEEM